MNWFLSTAGSLWLRTPKEDLLERWRRILFQLDKEMVSLDSIVSHRAEGRRHQVVSADYKKTMNQLKALGAEGIEAQRMSVDEIAVQILRGGKNVAAVANGNTI